MVRYKEKRSPLDAPRFELRQIHSESIQTSQARSGDDHRDVQGAERCRAETLGTPTASARSWTNLGYGAWHARTHRSRRPADSAGLELARAHVPTGLAGRGCALLVR